jgi:nucleoside phosphorylase
VKIVQPLLLACAVCFSARADTAILYALPSELAALKKELRMLEKPIKIADRQAYIGFKKGEKVILMQSGSGQIPATIATQAVISRFKPTRLISIGPAGNLRDDWKIGDVIVASDIVHYESGSEKSSGFILKEPAKLRKLIIETSIGKPARIASGDKFIATASKRAWLRDTFQADAVDMMSAAIAKTCEANDVPYVILRVLSDNADERASEDFAVFIRTESSPLPQIALKLLEQFKPQE